MAGTPNEPARTAEVDPLLVARARLVARAAGALVGFGGAGVLATGLIAPGLFSAEQSLPRAAVALCFVLAGAALHASVDPGHRARTIARGLDRSLALASLAMLCGPMRVPPVASMSFLLVAGTLWLMLDERTTRRTLEVALLGVTLLGMTVLMGLAYGVPTPLLARAPLVRATSLGFFSLCAGLLAARVEDGPVSLLVRRGLGGAVTRGVMIPTLFVLAGLRVLGQRVAVWDSAVGLTLMVGVSLSFVALLIVRTAAHLDRTDRERQIALEELQLAHDELEIRVEERTRELRASEAAMGAARDAAVKASRAKSEFLAAMSHELRTPLNAVIGVSWLLEQTELSAEQRQHAQLIRTGGMQLLAVVNDVLDLSKIEAGKLELVSDGFAPRSLVSGAVRLLAPRATEKGLALGEQIDPAVPTSLVGDEGRIRQVLLNLLGNAVKFTERGRVDVRVSAEPAGANMVRVTFAVRDTGIGIPEDKASMIFEKFTQADASTTRRYGGTGLGLNISRELVQLMGGAIQVTSKPGEGSEFRFTLELARGASAAPAPAALVPFAAAATRVRALVVEDDATNQFVARRMLELLGCVVDIAPSGLEALTRAAAQTYDIVFMDCQMPELDGYRTTARLRARTDGATPARVPIIGLTAYATPDVRQKCLDAGMDDYLAKPVSWERLRGTLMRWLPPAGVPSAPPAPAAVEPAAAAGILDPARLAFLTSLDPEQRQGLFADLVKVFGEATTALIDELKGAVAAGDDRGIRRLRHKLQGSCLNMGAVALAAAAGALDDEPAPDAAALARWVESLERELASARAELGRRTSPV